MNPYTKDQWWIVPVAAMGLALTAGFIALVYTYEASGPQKEEEEDMEASRPPRAEESEKEPVERKKSPWWLLPLLAAALAAFLNLFILLNAHVPSGSMEPTIATGSLMLGDRTAYLREDPQVGDVVFFRHESEFGRKILVKRVVALSGQTFSMKGGRVYLDGELLDEPYITEFSRDSYPETVVPEGCCIVLGDHRTNSNDARFWDDPFVRQTDLLARAMFVYFPEFHTF